MRRSSWVLVLCGLIGISGAVSVAGEGGETAAEMPEAIKAMMEKARGEGGGRDKKKDEYPPFDEVVEGFKKISPDGETFFTLWYKEKTDELLCQVPKKMLGQMFLSALTLSGGHPMTGAQAGHTLVKWEQFGKQLLLVEPDVRYVSGENSTVADAIKRTYSDVILKSCKILTESAGGDPVIDLGDLLKSSPPGFSNAPTNSSLSKWGEFKAFPKNIEIPVELAVSSPRGGPTERLVLHYSMSELPKNPGFKPRMADDRIGYFLTVRKDWSKKHDEKTLFDRYINRWDLQKVNPELALSPVKKPIIWYIEDTVPVRWRRYVKEGILEWNKAFEKCGYLDAIQVRQQTENEFADLDPADVRYNFFRWIVSGRSFAMGPSRDNPLTGEILDADIIMDDSMVRVWTQRHGIYGPKAMLGMEDDPMLNDFLTAHPSWAYQERMATLLPETMELLTSQRGHVDEWVEQVARRHDVLGASCSYAEGLKHQLAFDAAIAQSAGENGLPEEMLGQVIKEVVAHEVGHCLGLRHNFKASTWLSMEDVMKSTDADAANTGSVMDYNPTMYAVKDQEQPSYVSRTIGPYDYWAIEYGYRPVEKPYSSEEELLKAITDRVAENGLQYATDEDTYFFSPDPHVNRFDFGADPTGYAQHQMKLISELRNDLTEWAVEDGESYNRLRRTFETLLGTHGRMATFVARYVGGIHVNRDHKGDPNARDPFVPVSADKQRESLKFVCEYIFDDSAWQFSPELLNKLAAGRFGHWDSDEFDFEVAFPVHDMVARIQYMSLFQLLNPWTMTRLYDSEKQFAGDPFTLSEMMETLSARIWSELGENPSKGKHDLDHPYISSYRRTLQRQHLRLLINIALTEPNGMLPADAHALTTMALSDLSDQMKSALEKGGSNIDAYSRAHLQDSQKKIQQALDAVYNIQ